MHVSGNALEQLAGLVMDIIFNLMHVILTVAKYRYSQDCIIPTYAREQSQVSITVVEGKALSVKLPVKMRLRKSIEFSDAC